MVILYQLDDDRHDCLCLYGHSRHLACGTKDLIDIQLSKLLNYLELNTLAAIVYTIFMVIWSYFRIYLSALTLRSVYVDYHRIPAYARTFYPSRGHWLVWWMQCHVRRARES